MRKLITKSHTEETILDNLKSFDYGIIGGSNEECLPAEAVLRVPVKVKA